MPLVATGRVWRIEIQGGTMKKAQRQVYLELVKEVDWDLCGFCRYQKGTYCGDEDVVCTHPLDKQVNDDGCVMPGEDCWKFRPGVPIEDIADFVGIILAESFDPSRTTYRMKAGRISKVQGTKLRV